MKSASGLPARDVCRIFRRYMPEPSTYQGHGTTMQPQLFQHLCENCKMLMRRLVISHVMHAAMGKQ